MRVIDPGHFYELDHLDGDGKSLLRFVKRIGEKYPGNEPPGYEGVTIQEVLRALLDRMYYVDSQDPSPLNLNVIDHLRYSLSWLEERAAIKRGDFRLFVDALNNYKNKLEDAPTCHKCGHVACSVHGSL